MCPSCISAVGLRSHSLSWAYSQLLHSPTGPDMAGGHRAPGDWMRLHGRVRGLSVDTRQRLQPPPGGLSWLGCREVGGNRPEVPAFWGLCPSCCSDP